MKDPIDIAEQARDRAETWRHNELDARKAWNFEDRNDYKAELLDNHPDFISEVMEWIYLDDDAIEKFRLMLFRSDAILVECSGRPTIDDAKQFDQIDMEIGRFFRLKAMAGIDDLVDHKIPKLDDEG